MNTFFQKQGVTQVNLVFDKQEKTNSFLLSASDRERNIEVVNGDVYVNKARQKTVRIDDTLYWEDSEGRQWAIKGKHPMKPYRGVVNQNGSVQRFTALPTTSYLLYYTTKDESGQPQKIQFRLEYGLTTSDEGFITFFRFWYLNDGVEELAATNLSSDKTTVTVDTPEGKKKLTRKQAFELKIKEAYSFLQTEQFLEIEN